MAQFNPAMQVSVIVPVGLRTSDLTGLHRQYRQALDSSGRSYEFIYVLDGPLPAADAQLEQLMAEGEKITIVYLTRMFGESTALMAGFEQASGAIVVTLPAYDQIEAGEIDKL